MDAEVDAKIYRASVQPGSVGLTLLGTVSELKTAELASKAISLPQLDEIDMVYNEATNILSCTLKWNEQTGNVAPIRNVAVS